MEYLEMFGWVMLGFVPTLGVLEIASRRLGSTMRSEWSWVECLRNEYCQCLSKAYFLNDK